MTNQEYLIKVKMKWMLVITVVMLNFDSASQFWEQRIDHLGEHFTESAYDITLCDGNIFLSYSISGSQDEEVFGVSIINEEGDILSQHSYQTAQGLFLTWVSNCGVQLENGSVAYGLTLNPHDESIPLGATVLTMNCEGDTLWTRSFFDPDGITNWLGKACTQRTNGNIVLIGHTQGDLDEDIILIELNESGDLLNSQLIGSPDYVERGFSVEETNDGGLILGGSRAPIGFTNELYAIKLDASGDIDWEFEKENPHQDYALRVIERIPGEFVGAGRQTTEQTFESFPYVVCFGTNGQFNWDKYLGTIPTVAATLYGIQKTPENEILVAGYYKDYWQAQYGGLLAKLDYQGECVWMQEFLDSDGVDGYFFDVQIHENGEISVCGALEENNDLNQSQDCWLLHLDGEGCLVPGCTSVVGENSSYQLQTYPNPVRLNESFTIEMSSLIGGMRAHVFAYSSTGQMVRLCTNCHLANNPISTRKLSSGVWELQIIVDHTILRSRILIVH